jgi:hypothetical protein
MHKNCSRYLLQHLQNCIRCEPIQNRQCNNTATPCCGKILYTRDIYILYLFFRASCWHFHNFLWHTTIYTRQQLLHLKNWDPPGKICFIEVSPLPPIHSLFLTFSYIYSSFVSCAFSNTTFLEMNVKISDYWFVLIYPEYASHKWAGMETTSPLLSICCLEQVLSLSWPELTPPLMGLDLSYYILAVTVVGTSPETKCSWLNTSGMMYQH